MARGYAPFLALIALMALLGLMQWAAMPLPAKASPVLGTTGATTPIATELAATTVSTTLPYTEPPPFVANLYVTPSMTTAVLGGTVLVSLSLDVGPGCSYSTYEQTLTQSPTLFAYVDPPKPTVRSGEPFSGHFLLRAVQTGTVTFLGSLYGESYCGWWTWNSVVGASEVVTVTNPLPRQYFPRVCKSGCK